MHSKFRNFLIPLAALIVAFDSLMRAVAYSVGEFAYRKLTRHMARTGLILAVDSVLDVFNSDAFGFVALTDAINKMPFIPGRAGAVIDWAEQGVPLDTIEFEQVSNVLTLVNPTPRGGPGETRGKPKREVDVIKIPHYELNGGVNAAEVSGVRAFGQGSMMQTAQSKVAEVQMVQASDLDATLEYQRVGALKGIVKNGDGSTYLDLFAKFNVSAQTEVGLNLTNATPDGAVRTKCTGIKRSIAKALGGTPFTGVYAFCSDSFWDALIANAEVRASYLAQQEASQLRAGVDYGQFNFGGITFENYRGGTGVEEASAFIEADKAYFFPVGVPRLFRTAYAPADYWETVNTDGLPRYTRLFPWENQKGVSIDSQMNAISYCTRPRALVKGKIAA